MRIRHLVAADNIDAAGVVIDPAQVRHGLIVAGRVADLSGLIEPETHLNLDFTLHRLDECLVVERLERGAAVLWDDQQFRRAAVHPAAYTRRGPVNVDARRAAWQQRAQRPTPGGSADA